MNIERGPYTNAIVFTGGSYNIFSHYTKITMSIFRKPGHVICFDGPKKFELTERAIMYGYDQIVDRLNQFLQEQNSNTRFEYINNNRFVLDKESKIEPYIKAMPPEIILSKSYQFVEWLVKNDKIDFIKMYDLSTLHGIMILTQEDAVNRVLMELAIQTNPIEFLIAILK